jgi:hypothetical protein
MEELELERESLISQWKAELEAERETLEPPSLSHILHKALLEPCLETITSFLATALKYNTVRWSLEEFSLQLLRCLDTIDLLDGMVLFAGIHCSIDYAIGVDMEWSTRSNPRSSVSVFQ